MRQTSAGYQRHKYDDMVTQIRSLVNKHKYGSTTARGELITYLRYQADKLEKEQNTERELRNQGMLDV